MRGGKEEGRGGGRGDYQNRNTKRGNSNRPSSLNDYMIKCEVILEIITQIIY